MIKTLAITLDKRKQERSMDRLMEFVLQMPKGCWNALRVAAGRELTQMPKLD